MIREKIKGKIEKAIRELQEEGVFLKTKIPKIEVEKTKNRIHGDYSTNAAMRISKTVKKKPLEVANNLVSKLDSEISKIFKRIELVKPGFINFFISEKYLKSQLLDISKKKSSFFKLNIGKKKKVQVEFISANPTGPLTLGNGRGGFCGDVLANILEKVGYEVEKEYYINDRGEQIRKLGHSVIGDSQAVYKGEYIDNLRKRIKGNDPDKVGEKAAKIILDENIKPIVRAMKIKFNVWFSERSLYENEEVDKVLKYLKKKKLSYSKDGALWFKSTNFGDDKDRVLIREGGEKTYFASDITYLKNKFERGFEKIIYFWGADHYGYVNRMKAAAEALGYKKNQLDFVVLQLVAVMWAGEKQKMSKRKGIYWGLDRLIEDLGIDVVRFFFLTKSPGSHLIFDLDLAKEQSSKNPVYYIQYAFARICSILRKSEFVKKKQGIKKEDLECLDDPAEINLITQLIAFPEVLVDTAGDFQVQRLPKYALDLATAFHQFYEKCRVLEEEENRRKARTILIIATKTILEEVLSLIGIELKERM